MFSIKYTAQIKPRMTAPSSKIMLQTQHKKRRRRVSKSARHRRLNQKTHQYAQQSHAFHIPAWPAHAQQSKKDGTLCRKANKKRTPSRRTDNTARITKPKNGDKTNLSMTHEMPQNPLCNITCKDAIEKCHMHLTKKIHLRDVLIQEYSIRKRNQVRS